MSEVRLYTVFEGGGGRSKSLEDALLGLLSDVESLSSETCSTNGVIDQL